MGDAITRRLQKAIERPVASYLWVPGDTPRFKPFVLPKIYGDGRALFAFATLNQRPRYWVIQACSTWGSGSDLEDSPGPDFAEMTDDILTDLEGEFGRGRCGYSGNSLFWPKKERLLNCQCEECSDSHRAKWPEVDDEGGCSWSRLDWPDGFRVKANPVAPRTTILAYRRRLA